MSTIGKLVIGLIIAGVVVLILTALPAKSPGIPEADTSPIKVGLIAPLTGDAAVYGEPLANVVRLAVEEINAQNGVAGRPLEVIYEDGKCNGTDAANATQKLVNVDGVKAIIGGFCSSESLAAIPIVEQAKVALLSPGSSSPDLTGKSPFFARNIPSDATQGVVVATIASQDKKWKTVAFMQEQTDYALGLYTAFTTEFEKLGGKTTKEEFASTVTDLRSQLTKLKAAKPDALFIAAQTPATAERILKQLAELKWSVPLLGSDAILGDPTIVTNNAEMLEGTLGAEFGINPNNPKFQSLLAAYQTKFGSEMLYQSYGQTMYDAVYLLRDGLLAVGEDGELLANWLHQISNWQGASGSVTIGSNGDLVGGHVAKIIKDGKVELYPAPEPATEE